MCNIYIIIDIQQCRMPDISDSMGDFFWIFFILLIFDSIEGAGTKHAVQA